MHVVTHINGLKKEIKKREGGFGVGVGDGFSLMGGDILLAWLRCLSGLEKIEPFATGRVFDFFPFS